MKILHIARQSYPSIGGIESVVWNLTKSLQVLGHQVEILTLDYSWDRDEKLQHQEVVDGIVIHRIPYWGSKRYAIALSALSIVKNYDLLHIHSSDFFLDYMALSHWWHKKPILLHSHGMFFHSNFAKFFKTIYYHTVTRYNLLHVEAVVCDSKKDMRLMKGITSPQKLYHIPNGIEYQTISKLKHTKDKNLLLSVGRLSANKRYDRLLETFGIALESNPNLVLAIAGVDHGELENLQAKVLKIGIEKKVKFLGQVPQDILLQYLARASLWLSASEYESFGIALLEAMAAGCLPVVSPIPAFREIVTEKKNGLFANFDNPQRAANVILFAVDMSEQQKMKMIDAAKQLASNYSWNKIAQQVENIYRLVIQ